MRELHDHKLTGLNEAISIRATDDPGPGGANHSYTIQWGEPHPDTKLVFGQKILFQNGPIKETGINGISNEALLAIVIDRLRGFQYQRKDDGSFDIRTPGGYACRENAVALTKLEEAMMWLQKRTRERMARGVEGTNQK